ncbi:MAG: hypothetical protein ABIP93_08160 [Gemmatimonadaceae bacterium]
MSDQLPARWTDDVRRGSRRGARLPSREELRELVSAHQMEIREVVAVGANPQQLTLDHREKIRAYAAQLSKEDAAAVLRMYAEETTAATTQPMGDARLAAPAAAPKRSMTGVTAAIAVVVAVLVAVALFRACA